VTRLHSFQDDKRGCYANVRMSNGDPCWIGVAQTGVIVKKSRIGLFGAKLYDESRIFEAANDAEWLANRYPNQLVPDDMTSPVLAAFTNAVLQCETLVEVVSTLNGRTRAAG